jgi:hypothetical protein
MTKDIFLTPTIAKSAKKAGMTNKAIPANNPPALRSGTMSALKNYALSTIRFMGGCINAYHDLSETN